MANTTLGDLIADLKFYSGYQASQDIDDPNDLKRAVVIASRKHNPDYVCEQGNCTIPLREHDAITFLACVQIFYVRAAKHSEENTTQASGGNFFSANRDTPFDKNMKLVAEYTTRYEQQCKLLGLDAYGGNGPVEVTEVVIEDLSTNVNMRVEATAAPPAIKLSAAATVADVDGKLIISWTQKNFSNFASFEVYYLQDATIYQEWNVDVAASASLRINSEATLVVTLTDHEKTSVRLTGLSTTAGAAHHILVLCKSKSGKYSYSNELVLTQV